MIGKQIKEGDNYNEKREKTDEKYSGEDGC